MRIDFDSETPIYIQIAEEIEEKEQSIFKLVSQGMALKDARSQVGYHHLQTRE